MAAPEISSGASEPVGGMAGFDSATKVGIRRTARKSIARSRRPGKVAGFGPSEPAGGMAGFASRRCCDKYRRDRAAVNLQLYGNPPLGPS